MTYYLFGAFFSLLLRVVPAKAGYFLSPFIGIGTYLLWPRGRDCLRENLAHVLGEGAEQKQLNRLAQAIMGNYYRYLIDFLRLPYIKPQEITKRVTLQGTENVEKALMEGKGAICVGLHAGDWDMMAAAFVLEGYPLNVVVESFPLPRLDEFMHGRRRAKGMNVIHMEGGTDDMVQALRNNETLAILIDIPDTDKSVEVKFFDANTRMARGIATLALRTKARVLPVSSVRLPDNSVIGMLGEPIQFKPSKDLSRDTETLTQLIMSSLEGYISQHPDQWYMFRSMWPPKDEASH